MPVLGCSRHPRSCATHGSDTDTACVVVAIWRSGKTTVRLHCVGTAAIHVSGHIIQDPASDEKDGGDEDSEDGEEELKGGDDDEDDDEEEEEEEEEDEEDDDDEIEEDLAGVAAEREAQRLQAERKKRKAEEQAKAAAKAKAEAEKAKKAESLKRKQQEAAAEKAEQAKKESAKKQKREAQADTTASASDMKKAVAKLAPAPFTPAKKFSGARPGCVFKKGPKGVGYYLDVKPKPGAKAAGGAFKQMRGLKYRDLKPGTGAVPKKGPVPPAHVRVLRV